MAEPSDLVQPMPGSEFLLPGQTGELLRRWAQPHRRYHTVEHLKAVLSHLDSLAAAGTEFDAEPVYLAAWFHDAIYEIGRSDNESASARLAREMLADHRAPVVDEVVRLVEATTTHDVESHDHNAAALSDADLAVLGGSAADYARYAAAVRAEYAEVDDSVFGPARAAILRAMLSSGTIYATAYGRKRWEAPARANVAAEIARLVPA